MAVALLVLLVVFYASRLSPPEPQPEALLQAPALPTPLEAPPGAPEAPPTLRAASQAEAPQAEAPQGAVSLPQAAAPPLAAPESPPVPLEKLLKWEEPRPAPRGIDLGDAAAPPAPSAAGSEPGLRDRVYLQRRTDEVGPGDRERKLETTDVGVRVPVASSVEVRGGVRIESRQDGKPEASTNDPTPTVGVGVNF
jgi:hypothetical protein